MRRRFKHLVSGLVFAFVWWAIYRSHFARVLDVFVMAAIAGAIVWMTWDLFKWMCHGRALGPTELSAKPQFPWSVLAVPFAALASTFLFVVLARRSGFLAGRWEGLAVVGVGVVAALWSGILMSSTEFRASGLVYSGRAILWEEVGEYTWISMLGEAPSAGEGFPFQFLGTSGLTWNQFSLDIRLVPNDAPGGPPRIHSRKKPLNRDRLGSGILPRVPSWRRHSCGAGGFACVPRRLAVARALALVVSGLCVPSRHDVETDIPDETYSLRFEIPFTRRDTVPPLIASITSAPINHRNRRSRASC